MKKILGYIFSPLHYIAFGFMLCLFHPIQWVCLKLGGYTAHKKSVDILNFCLVCTYYLNGTRVRFFNKKQLPRERPVIFIANHQSMYDIPPLIWYLRKYHAKFISKIELTKGIPSISFNLKYGGAANIDRRDPKQSISEIIKLGKRMSENGWSAVIFPEGTRTKTGRVKSFSAGGVAALLKKAPQALIVPIAISGSWEFTRYGSYPLSFGEKINFTALAPIETTSKTAEEIVLEAEKMIKAKLVQV